MSRYNIVNTPKVYPKLSHEQAIRAGSHSDAPTMCKTPLPRVFPAKDFAPKLITDVRAELASALRECNPFAHHVAFYHWHIRQ